MGLVFTENSDEGDLITDQDLAKHGQDWTIAWDHIECCPSVHWVLVKVALSTSYIVSSCGDGGGSDFFH